MQNCTVDELNEKRQRGEDVLIVDVRTASELAIADLGGVCHIPLDEVAMRAEEIAAWKDKEVICMCHHGMRSARAQAILQHAGFTNVRNLTGGIHAWSTQIDPGVPQY